MARIILIEDNEQLRALLADCLGGAGHDVWHTDDVAAGLAESERRPVDVVITDLLVANPDALEKLLAPSASGAPPEVVATSGAPDSPGYVRLAHRLGWSRMLAKPFRPDTLLHVIDRVVADRRYRCAWAALHARSEDTSSRR